MSRLAPLIRARSYRRIGAANSRRQRGPGDRDSEMCCGARRRRAADPGLPDRRLFRTLFDCAALEKSSTASTRSSPP